MTGQRDVRWWCGTLLAIAVTATLLAACSSDPGPDAAPPDRALCERQIRSVVDELQAYVDGFNGISALEYVVGTGVPDPGSVERALLRHGERLEGFECDPVESGRRLRSEMGRLRGDGALADAIADTLRLRVAGMRTDLPREIEVDVDDDLPSLAATAPPGSTLRLSPGEHRAEQPVVVPDTMTIIGAGQEHTRLTSTADGSAVMALESAELELADLTVTHDSVVTSAVVLVASPTYQLRDVTIQGGRVDEDGVGGIGLHIGWTLVGPPERIEADADPRQVLDRVRVEDNQGPGLYVTGSVSPLVTGGSFNDNGMCGVCFLQDAAGHVEDSAAAGNDVGVLLSGRVDPQVSGTAITDNADSGIAIEGSGRGHFHDNVIAGNGERGVTVSEGATPRFDANRIVGNGQVGIAIFGAARPTFDRNAIIGNPIGVWVDQEAQPTFSSNDIDREAIIENGEVGLETEDIETADGSDGVGVVLAGAARGSMAGDVVRRYPLGIELREDAQLELMDSRIKQSGEAAVVVRDQATVTGAGTTCDAASFGVVVLDDGANDLDDDGCPEHTPP